MLLIFVFYLQTGMLDKYFIFIILRLGSVFDENQNLSDIFLKFDSTGQDYYGSSPSDLLKKDKPVNK